MKSNFVNRRKRPVPYEYRDFRVYLEACFQFKKSLPTGNLTFRTYSNSLGFRSPNYLRYIIQGNRNLSTHHVDSIIQGLSLNKSEGEFFRNLVHFNQAKTIDETNRFAKNLSQTARFRKMNPITKSQFKFYSHWYNIAIREMLTLPDFQDDPKWIASRLRPPISPKEARKALKEMKTLGLIKRDETGKWSQSSQNIFKNDDIFHSVVASYHKEMIKKAGEAMDRFDKQSREVNSSTFNLSKEKYIEIRQILRDLQRRLMSAEQETDKSTDVYQLNIQLFPLTGKPKGEKK